MKLALSAVMLVAAVSPLVAEILPLTSKDVGLMLRSGYSNEAVMTEVSKRHFAGSLDPESVKKLSAAGASEALLAALRSGTYQISEEEAERINQKLAAQKERAEQAPVVAAPGDKTKKASDPARASVPANTRNEVYELLKGSLVSAHQGAIAHFEDDGLPAKKFFLFFFSANWSKAGRNFTPQLIDYYNRQTQEHPEFEVIFFSADRSQFGMETYMTQSSMPWPAVAYSEIDRKAEGMENEFMKDLPGLILVDAGGRILSKSGAGGEGMDRVLADLDKVFAYTAKQALARAR